MNEPNLPESTPGVLAEVTPAAVRRELETMVVRDLLGPVGGDDETLEDNPSDRYLIGRLAPGGEALQPDLLDSLAESEAASSSPEDDGDREPEAPNIASLQPSAVGLTVCVDGSIDRLVVDASWANYQREAAENTARPHTVQRRHPAGGSVTIKLAEGRIDALAPDAEHDGVKVRGRIRRFDDDWLVSLFLVNEQPETSGSRNWIYQVELIARGAAGTAPFKPRPSLGSGGGDPADRREQAALAMAYRFLPEFVVGHGTGVHSESAVDNPMRAVEVRTVAAPAYEVPATDVPGPHHKDDADLPELADLVLDMQRLATLESEPLQAALMPLVSGYRSWIERARQRIGAPDGHLDDYVTEAEDNLWRAEVAAGRIEAGIAVLQLPDALAAFRFANHAMHRQRVHTIAAAERRRDPAIDLPAAVAQADMPKNRSWRPFQLAFLLLNLPSLTDPGHQERAESDTATGQGALADLLWFPTGGGKTEAYLGLTAFTLAIRRRRPDLGGLDAANGVAVLMRYTLRLLTIQQFQRAAALICACEDLRRADPATWGTAPFRLGLWVGAQVTPNRTDQAHDWLTSLKRAKGKPGRAPGSPHQLTSCPWCGTKIEPGRDIAVDRVRRRTVITCSDPLDCPFGDPSLPIEEIGLPVVVVDEEIYRLLPSLVIATVDKFAQLPWKGETQALFGHVKQRCTRHGYVTPDLLAADDWERGSHPAMGDHPAATLVAAKQVRPPDLIIQDELHLISGPLGSMTGLYESAVDKLATWEIGSGKSVRPKVIASTATVRRADRQIQSLFNRRTDVFPPPGLEARDNFFARQRSVDDQPGRRYVGICAQGVRTRSTLIRMYVAVLGAAQALHEKYGRNEVTDPYMTLVGYFNSLRDLGGMRRLVEDDVTTRLQRGEIVTQHGFAKRYSPELRELTSRLTADDIPDVLEHLEQPFGAKGERKPGRRKPVDVLVATNMIAVGVDVSRLGVMVVTNQPKSTAEYIQATSRVGRQAPGLVFTVLNWARPRDLSHYESFESFHSALYRHVEALSVTPFADRAVDRGLTGVLAALVRDLEPKYNANTGAQHFDTRGKLADHVLMYLRRRAADVAVSQQVGRTVSDHLQGRLDHWGRMQRQTGSVLGYRRPYRVNTTVTGLLYEPDGGPWRLTTCPTSLREVEPGVRLILQAEPEPGGSQDPPFKPRPTQSEDPS
ncbi:DISARM system helicase DrmA [Embleya sp. NPDC005971]|uniref:DISARM system helicase DrmA n=1 Tax=Embleya sp. NPDC005971 TaxID=3156724 RepID=UPI0033F65E0B